MTDQQFDTFISLLTVFLHEVKKERRADNARASLEKAKSRGTKLGRKKIRNDDEIKELRSKGLSMRRIASETGVSTMAVQRSLKEAKS